MSLSYDSDGKLFPIRQEEFLGVGDLAPLCHARVMLDIQQATPELIAVRVRWLRSYYDLTQAQLAESLGMNGSQARKWENGKNRLSIDGALAIKSVYGIPLDFLYFGDTGSMSSQHLKSWIEYRQTT